MERSPGRSGGTQEAEQIDGPQLGQELVARLATQRDEALGYDDQEHASVDENGEPTEAAGRASARRRTAGEQPTPDRESTRPILANVYTDPPRHTVTLLLDDVTANIVLYAVRVLAADSEAHAREVRLVGAAMPPDSYGAANRHAIASRHERIAARLRVLEFNYYNVTTTPGRG